MTPQGRDIGSRIADSVGRRGVVGTMQAAVRAALHPLLGHQRVIEYRERRFDRRHRVTTAGIIPRDRLEIGGPSAQHVTHYQAAQPVQVEGLVGGLGIDYERYTFVDFGCGKGKALLLASSFRFARIVGLELSPALAKIAASNVTTFRSRRQRCRQIEVRCIDALDFELPPVPLVCFLYNPFGEAVLAQVIERMGRSLIEHPRDLIVVYLHPEADRVFDHQSFLVRTKHTDWACVYRSRSSFAA
jgi:SAM-dependent methyltransferase